MIVYLLVEYYVSMDMNHRENHIDYFKQTCYVSFTILNAFKLI